MITILVKCALCVIVLLNRVQGEVFSATIHLESLLKAHDKVIYDLEEYIGMEKKRLNVLETHLSLYKTEHKKAIEDIPNYIENPVNSYTLIKRLTTDLEFMEDISKASIEFDRDEALVYPTREDLEGAMAALARLQDTYRLNATLLASGLLNGTFSRGSQPFIEKFTPMSASDCYELGSSLYKDKNYKIAIAWLLEAYEKYDENTPEAYSFRAVDIVEQIAKAYQELDDIRNAFKWIKMLLKMKQDITNSLVKEFEERLAKEENAGIDKKVEGQVEMKQEVLSENEVGQNVYKALCRGEMDSPSVPAKRLKCRYLTETHPFLKIAPIKLEELFTEPDVYLFHNVLTDEEINYIKMMARPQVSRAKIGDGVISPYRTSKSAWLADDDGVISRVSRRVMHFTGMSLELSEDLLVANYGIGGHYGPHYDFSENTEEKFSKSRDRIGTVLFYMSNVAQGGATVFTKLGLTVFPVKGAAIFWWNLHPSGENDYNTYHAACPVLRGSKWVANQWISESGQEFLQPCNLKYQDVNYNQNIPPPIPKFP